MLPSELRDEQVIQIRSNTGVIEFHFHEGELYVSAKGPLQRAGDGKGITIPLTNQQADGLYRYWQELVNNREKNLSPWASPDVVIVEPVLGD